MSIRSDTAEADRAFIDTFTLAGRAGGPLAGLSFAAKDIFDVAGHVTGCGNPDWARSHGPATTHAAAVAMLLDAGAHLVGKSHTDELAYSLMGVNAHYGTPPNPKAPDRVPGGSSSGSASAVAAGLADIGLGSDTGGSVRLPASFCGLWGLRTTHGRVPLDGAMALAPSFDTVGWFAREVETLQRVADVAGCHSTGWTPNRVLLPVDLWARAEAATVEALAPTLVRLEHALGPAVPVVLAPERLETWRETFRVCQAAEVWQVHGTWIEATKPKFGAGTDGRFRMAASINEAEWRDAERRRAFVQGRLESLLADDGLLVLPTAPAPAPLREADDLSLNDYRTRALELLCAAGLAGLPQLSIPGAQVARAPVGLSLLGPRHRDGDLLALAKAVA